MPSFKIFKTGPAKAIAKILSRRENLDLERVELADVSELSHLSFLILKSCGQISAHLISQAHLRLRAL